MRKWTAAAITTLLASGCIQSAAYCLEPMPEIPKQGKTLDDFVPKDWRVFKQAEGDLNFDKVNDRVLILARMGDEPESGYSEDMKQFWPRPLVVLHTQKDGSFENVCTSPGAVMCGEVGNNFALNVVDVKIAGGNIVVNNANGATSVAAFESKYRLQNGKYELIGLTESGGNTREGVFYSIDTNLNTSRNEEDDSQQDMSNEDAPAKSTTWAYYFVRAGLAQKAPSMTGEFVAQDWPGPPVTLKQKANVAVGKKLWRQASDLSARLYGVRTKSDLFIAAKVTDKVPNKAVFLRLSGAKNSFSPAQTSTTVTKDGEYIVARFPLSSLSKITVAGQGRAPADYKSIEASVQIVEPGQDGKPQLVLSTSCDAEKHTGAIELTKTPALPTLENWDWAHRDQ